MYWDFVTFVMLWGLVSIFMRPLLKNMTYSNIVLKGISFNFHKIRLISHDFSPLNGKRWNYLRIQTPTYYISFEMVESRKNAKEVSYTLR